MPWDHLCPAWCCLSTELSYFQWKTVFPINISPSCGWMIIILSHLSSTKVIAPSPELLHIWIASLVTCKSLLLVGVIFYVSRVFTEVFVSHAIIELGFITALLCCRVQMKSSQVQVTLTLLTVSGVFIFLHFPWLIIYMNANLPNNVQGLPTQVSHGLFTNYDGHG